MPQDLNNLVVLTNDCPLSCSEVKKGANQFRALVKDFSTAEDHVNGMCTFSVYGAICEKWIQLGTDRGFDLSASDELEHEQKRQDKNDSV